MAKSRLLKLIVVLIALSFTLVMLSGVVAWMVIRRGPTVPEHATLILRIGGTLVENPPADAFELVTGGARSATVRSYIDVLHRAKSDARIASVLIVPTHFDLPYWAKVQELRDAILDFRKYADTRFARCKALMAETAFADHVRAVANR